MDFFIIGSQRCGTTWVHKFLEEYDLNLPINKQTYFFDRNIHLGLNWYHSQFSNANSSYKKGEVATGYCLREAFSELNRRFPDAKLILLVRDPIDRCYSNYAKRRDEYGSKSFVQVLNEDSEIIDRSLYGEMIENIYELGRADDLLVLFYEDLATNPRDFALKILDHIGVSYCKNKIELKLPGVVNSSRFSEISRWMRISHLGWLLRLLRVFRVKQALELIFKIKKRKNAKIPDISALDESILFRLIESNEKLFKYTGRGYDLRDYSL